MKKGYKAFHLTNDNKLYCKNNFIFEIGNIYEESEAVMCQKGFHYCSRVEDVFKYYSAKANIVVVCEVLDLSPNTQIKNNKSCTEKIQIGQLLDGIIDGCHFKKGKLHRDGDLPAVEFSDGDEG